MTYQDFIQKKLVLHEPTGFAPSDLPESLFDFQAAIVDWAVRRGRAAIFADTGLGKTAMQLAWADQVARHTGRSVLILAPLCIAQQTVREAARIGIDGVRYTRTKAMAIDARIIVTKSSPSSSRRPCMGGGAGTGHTGTSS